MSGSDERTLGLLLRSIPYLSAHRILTVLSPESGVLSLMAKSHGKGSKQPWSGLTIPFVLAEWVYHPGKKEISPLIDGTLIDPLASLKNDYKCLMAAGQIAQDLLRTQMPGKPAPSAFALAVACLQRLSEFADPMTLAAVFRLKLLFCEGLFDPEETRGSLGELARERSFQALGARPCNEALIAEIGALFEERLGG